MKYHVVHLLKFSGFGFYSVGPRAVTSHWHAVRKGLGRRFGEQGHRPARLEGRQGDTVSTSFESTLKLSRTGRVGGSGNEGDVMNNKMMSGREGV